MFHKEKKRDKNMGRAPTVRPAIQNQKQKQNWMPPYDLADVEGKVKGYPWSKIGDEQLPDTNAKQDYFDAVVQYSADQVKSAFANSQLSKMQLVLLDSEYYCLPKDKIDAMVPEIITSHYHYLSDRNDCDKFALAFANSVVWEYCSNGVGIVLDSDGQHAYNCLVVSGDDNTLSIEIVEPQDDSVVSTPDAHHVFKNGLILLF